MPEPEEPDDLTTIARKRHAIDVILIKIYKPCYQPFRVNFTDTDDPMEWSRGNVFTVFLSYLLLLQLNFLERSLLRAVAVSNFPLVAPHLTT